MKLLFGLEKQLLMSNVSSVSAGVDSLGARKLCRGESQKNPTVLPMLHRPQEACEKGVGQMEGVSCDPGPV